MYLNSYLIYLNRFLIDFQQTLNFRFPICFRDPNFPNSFRKNRSPMAPQGKPLCGKESHMDPLHVRFSSQTSESMCFLQIKFHFFMKTLFPPFVRLRPVQAGFCVSMEYLGNILGIYWVYIGNIYSFIKIHIYLYI